MVLSDAPFCRKLFHLYVILSNQVFCVSKKITEVFTAEYLLASSDGTVKFVDVRAIFSGNDARFVRCLIGRC